MSSACKAAIPGATVTVSPQGSMPWEAKGTKVVTPEACRTVCLAVLQVIPGKAERTRLRNIMADELENIDPGHREHRLLRILREGIQPREPQP